LKLSTRARYGTRAAFELARRHGSGPVHVHDIADAQDISPHYLVNILNILRKCGIVTSKRGANGGFILQRSPEEITVGDIVRAVDGPLDLVDCTGRERCVRIDHCPTYDVWARLTKVIERELDAITLDDLVVSHRRKTSPLNAEYII
jgi:Rrf2 family transcriptional regulator, cysteine metabolism repressor